MAKQLAIEWDQHELRVIAAAAHGGRVEVTDAFTISIAGDDPAAIGVKLSEALADHGLRRLPALIAIGRGRAEMRQLNLPSIPADELPDVVRFQAVRQFAAAGERALVDFLVTSSNDNETEVVAAAIDPEQVAAIRKVCEMSELSLRRIALRPTAAAALAPQSEISKQDETILIDTLAGEVDIVVMRGTLPVFLRSVLLPDAGELRTQAVVSEVRRSLMAMRRDQREPPEQRVILWGRESVHTQLLSELSKALDTQVDAIDPFNLVDASRQTIDSVGPHVGRFAPLIGLLMADAAGGEGLIDFLNPRERPEPTSRRDRYAIYGALAAAVVLLIGSLGWSRLRSLDSKYEKTLRASNDLTEAVEAASISKANLQRIDNFLNGDVFVLGELAYLSERLGSAEQLRLEQLTVTAEPRGGATILLSGVATSPTAVTEMERRLRDEDHEVIGDGVKTASRDDGFKYQFSETIRISAERIGSQRRTREPPADLTAQAEDGA